MSSNPYAPPAGSVSGEEKERNPLLWLLVAFVFVITIHGLTAVAAYHVHEWKLPTDFSKPSDSALIVWLINAPVALFVNVMIAYRLYPRLSLYVPVLCGVVALPFLPFSLVTIGWIVTTAMGEDMNGSTCARHNQITTVSYWHRPAPYRAALYDVFTRGAS